VTTLEELIDSLIAVARDEGLAVAGVINAGCRCDAARPGTERKRAQLAVRHATKARNRAQGATKRARQLLVTRINRERSPAELAESDHS